MHFGVPESAAAQWKGWLHLFGSFQSANPAAAACAAVLLLHTSGLLVVLPLSFVQIY